MDLKRVNRIGQKYKDITNGYLKIAQALFHVDNSYFNIVDLIKHIILLYYHHLFESKILSEEEQDKFITFLKTNNKHITNYEWELIYDSTKDGLKADTFVNKVYDR